MSSANPIFLFFKAKNICLTKIHRQVVEVCGEGVMNEGNGVFCLMGEGQCAQSRVIWMPICYHLQFERRVEVFPYFAIYPLKNCHSSTMILKNLSDGFQECSQTQAELREMVTDWLNGWATSKTRESSDLYSIWANA
jgi:hypothetical protein